jgi:hypothetical protein
MINIEFWLQYIAQMNLGASLIHGNQLFISMIIWVNSRRKNLTKKLNEVGYFKDSKNPLTFPPIAASFIAISEGIFLRSGLGI